MPFDKEKYRSINANRSKRQWGTITKDIVTGSGEKAKQTRDEAGNFVTVTDNAQHVAIRPQTITLSVGE